MNDKSLKGWQDAIRELSDIGPKFPVGSLVTFKKGGSVYRIIESVKYLPMDRSHISWAYTLKSVENGIVDTAFEWELAFRYSVGDET